MKKILATALIIGSSIAVFGQGTVYFSNDSSSRMSLMNPYSGPENVPTTPGLINYGLFYGIGQNTSLTLSTIGVNSTSTAGIIASAVDSTSLLTAVPIVGTTPNESDVWFQVKAWSAVFGIDWAAARAASNDNTGRYFFGETDIRNIVLGPSTGPGVRIWQPATGTDPQKFHPIVLYTSIPEPSALALAGLGGAILAVWRRGRIQER